MLLTVVTFYLWLGMHLSHWEGLLKIHCCSSSPWGPALQRIRVKENLCLTIPRQCLSRDRFEGHHFDWRSQQPFEGERKEQMFRGQRQRPGAPWLETDRGRTVTQAHWSRTQRPQPNSTTCCSLQGWFSERVAESGQPLRGQASDQTTRWTPWPASSGLSPWFSMHVAVSSSLQWAAAKSKTVVAWPRIKTWSSGWKPWTWTARPQSPVLQSKSLVLVYLERRNLTRRQKVLRERKYLLEKQSIWRKAWVNSARESPLESLSPL